MKTSLLSNLTEEEAKIVTEEFKRCPTLRRTLREMFKRKADSVMRSMVSQPVEGDYAVIQAQKAAEAKAFLNFFALLED